MAKKTWSKLPFSARVEIKDLLLQVQETNTLDEIIELLKRVLKILKEYSKER